MWYAIWIMGLAFACGMTIFSAIRWEKKKKTSSNILQPDSSPALKSEPSPDSDSGALALAPQRPIKKVVLKKKATLRKKTVKAPPNKKGTS